MDVLVNDVAAVDDLDVVSDVAIVVNHDAPSDLNVDTLIEAPAPPTQLDTEVQEKSQSSREAPSEPEREIGKHG